MRVLLDTNVILDLALGRAPFFDDAKQIIKSSSPNLYSAYVTSASVTDIHYIASKTIGKTKSLVFLKDLVKTVDFCDSDKQIIYNALHSEFKDFEDAVQYFSALKAQIDIIVTRNEKDFKLAKKIEVLNPKQFVEKYLQINEEQSDQ